MNNLVRTIEGKILQGLQQNGLFENEAKAILDAFKSSEAGKSMEGRWSEDFSLYPAILMNVLWMGVKSEAYDWLTKNKPQHWARGMFAPIVGGSEAKPDTMS